MVPRTLLTRSGPISVNAVRPVNTVQSRTSMNNSGRKPTLSFMRPIGYPVTILNTIDHLGKFDEKVDEGFFVGYSTNTKAFRVFNSRTRIVEENMHVNFSEDTPNIAGSGPNWLFDIDALTNSMNYKPDVARNQSNGNAGTKACDDAVQRILLMQIQPSGRGKDDERIQGMKIVRFQVQKSQEVVACMLFAEKKSMDVWMIKYANWKKLADLNPKKVVQALKDPSWIEAMQEELLQFKLQEVWSLVELPNGKRAIGRYGFQEHEDERGLAFLAFASFKDFNSVSDDIKMLFLYCKLKKEFGSSDVKTSRIPMETQKALFKDADGEDVDEHLYRSMVGSLMYLTSSRPDIMFAVSYSDSDYAGASLDRKSTTGGCQFLGSRLISWQCKKQTIVTNSTTEVEYVAAASYCGQVLWIQNQMLDYGYNFMNTKIFINNESTICIVKNPVFHSKTKHIKIRHHFIRDSNEKKLIQMIKIHTDQNVADLLTKGFDRIMHTCCLKWKGIAANDEIHVSVVGLTFYWSVNVVRLNLVLLVQVNVVEGDFINTQIDDDAEGTECLLNANNFEQLTLMGYENLTQKLTFYKAFFSPQWKFLIDTILQCLSAKTTPWNEFSSTMASTVICIATNQKFNFSKCMFDNMVKNLEGGVKFLMYPRFVQVFLDKQVEGMSKHKEIYVTPSHTKKTSQVVEITKLKERVKRLEKKGGSRTHRLKRLYKVGRSARVVSSEDEGLGDQEDASKQGRKIDEIDQDTEVTLVDETKRRYDDNLMFDTGVLDNEQDMAKKEVDMAEKDVSNADPVTTAGEVVTTTNVIVSTAEVTIDNTTIITVNELTLA
ncbi:putative ribonuclease H-like domain-containing protein [Tanacetum coccineum]